MTNATPRSLIHVGKAKVGAAEAGQWQAGGRRNPSVSIGILRSSDSGPVYAGAANSGSDTVQTERAMPTCLILPGLNGSGADHWQTRWEDCRDDCQRVEFGCWSLPDRSVWLSKLDDAVARASTPVILVAHSLGCHAVAWWTARASAASVAKIAAAMLVAPPDLGSADLMEQLQPFAPPKLEPLPFRSLLVASRDDPYTTFASSERLARSWTATLVDVGRQGHLNAQSCLGSWPEGQRLLDGLIAQSLGNDTGQRVSRVERERRQ